MKINSMVSVIAATLLSTSLAYAMPPKPAMCPDASALQGVSLDVVQRDKDGTWAGAVISNKYNTTDKWTFVIGKIPASDEGEARTKAADAMTSLKFDMGPVAVQQFNVWACLYSNAKNYPAITITPALGFKLGKQII